MNFLSGFFVLKKMRSSLYHFLKTKKRIGAQLVSIVFAVALSWQYNRIISNKTFLFHLLFMKKKHPNEGDAHGV
jgi:hypothetical protein